MMDQRCAYSRRVLLETDNKQQLRSDASLELQEGDCSVGSSRQEGAAQHQAAVAAARAFVDQVG